MVLLIYCIRTRYVFCTPDNLLLGQFRTFGTAVELEKKAKISIQVSSFPIASF